MSVALCFLILLVWTKNEQVLNNFKVPDPIFKIKGSLDGES